MWRPGTNRFHHNRTVSWLTSIPRSDSRPSTFRQFSGKRTNIITTNLMTPSEELKRMKGLSDLALDLRLKSLG